MPSTQTRGETHRYGLELLLPDGRRVQELALEQGDFSRAIEATFFDALRRGLFADYSFSPDAARIEPRFTQPGQPNLEGFDVVLPTPTGEERRTFSANFFQGLALETGARLAAAGQLGEEIILVYQLQGYPHEPVPAQRGGLLFDLASEPTVIPIREGSRREIGPTEAWDGPKQDDFPVLIPRHVIQEGVEEARRHPEREVGGVLLGHLRRDRESGELYLEVTCFVPGEETEATNVSVTFTHATWARVREVVQWRGEEELIVGWVHSHPFRVCSECPLPMPPECQAKVLFYSRDDEFLMSLSFPRPFMVGLLTALEPRLEGVLGHLPVKLYGWRAGRIEARGFEVID
jgi:proteasome lid subunit RPN8/RPN11